MLPMRFRRFVYGFAVCLAVVTMGLVPLMQPFAGMIDLPCTSETSAQSSVSAYVTADCTLCPEHKANEQTQETVCPVNFHFCCAPVLGLLTSSVEMDNEVRFFVFDEPELPQITAEPQAIFRPPQSVAFL